jgi:hypothetical protein
LITEIKDCSIVERSVDDDEVPCTATLLENSGRICISMMKVYRVKALKFEAVAFSEKVGNQPATHPNSVLCSG